MKKSLLSLAALAAIFSLFPAGANAAGSTPMSAINQAVIAFNSGKF